MNGIRFVTFRIRFLSSCRSSVFVSRPQGYAVHFFTFSRDARPVLWNCRTKRGLFRRSDCALSPLNISSIQYGRRTRCGEPENIKIVRKWPIDFSVIMTHYSSPSPQASHIPGSGCVDSLFCVPIPRQEPSIVFESPNRREAQGAHPSYVLR